MYKSYLARAGFVSIFIITVMIFLLLSHKVLALNSNSIDLERSMNQHLSISDASQNGSLDVTGDITIEAWVKLESLPDNGQAFRMAGKWHDSDESQRAYDFNYYNNNGTYELYLYFRQSPGAASTAGHIAITFSTGVWYHITAVGNAAGADVDIFINGIPQYVVMDVNGSTSIQNTSSAFAVGAQASNGADVFDGLIDDVRVWNVARSESEIAGNMNTELVGNESGLVGYWKLNNSLQDSTANGNTLTNNNVAAFSTDLPFSPPPAPAAPTLTFSASPETILQGANSTLTWQSQDAASCSASGGWSGSKTLSGSEIVSPSATTTYTLECTGDGGSVSKQANVNIILPPPPSTIEILKVRKSSDESVSKSTVLQNDDQLTLTLAPNKTYIIDGVVFTSAPKKDVDIKIGFFGPAGSDLTIGYLTDSSSRMLAGGEASPRIMVSANSPVPIYVKGTIQVAGTAGTFQFKWAQGKSNAAATSVLKGSYLRAEEI